MTNLHAYILQVCNWGIVRYRLYLHALLLADPIKTVVDLQWWYFMGSYGVHLTAIHPEHGAVSSLDAVSVYILPDKEL